ncbi:AAA family ATPase [Heliorestis acidaminivorans]|uniref:Nuclease SbcCD subunit C n=1 Tax=Heliorestis acidaminivorans TaxID=553427 RepID=A0A6I0F3G2_9FIRM|nr:AAA family ATPase [Heliorestis acidaminivorans]KAB2954280.1 AAA family ATPase [Heliorestis acidaminivorans]
MKPLKLTISGLNSFRQKQEIHFDKLIDAGLFGIFGKTGSGKSTILDAITLALYGEVLRAERGTQGIINHGEKSVEVSFCFELGTGDERQQYRVDRRYVRVGESNSTKNTLCRLVLLNSNNSEEVIQEGIRDVKEAVTALLGMTCDDFTRAVVLPQGRFAEFLSLGGKERRDMLQRLFKLEQYGRQLADNLNKRNNRLNEDKGKVESELKGLGNASSEALAEAEKAMNSAKKEETESKAFLEQVQKALQELRQLFELQEKAKKMEQQYQEHIGQKDLLVKTQELVKQAEKALKVYPLVQKEAQRKAEEQNLAEEKQSTSAMISNLADQFSQCQKAWIEAKKEREEQEPLLIGAKARFEEALKIEKAMTELSVIIKDISKSLKSHEEEAQKAREQSRKWLTQKASCQQALRTAEGEIVLNTVEAIYRQQVTEGRRRCDDLLQKEKAYLDTMDEVAKRESGLKLSYTHWKEKGIVAKKLQRQWQELKKQEEEISGQPPVQENDLTRFEVRLEEMRLRRRDLMRLEATWQRLQRELKEEQENLQSLTTEKQKEALRQEVIERELEQYKEQLEQLFLQDKVAMATELAEDLQPGQPCLVCGSLEHPRPRTLIEEEQAEPLRNEEKEKLEKKIAEQEAKLVEVKSTIEKINLDVQRLEASKAYNQEREEEIRAEINTLCAECNQQWPGKTPLDLSLELAGQESLSLLLMKRIEAIEKALLDKKKQLEQWKKEREKSQKNIQSCHDNWAKAKADYDTGEQLVKKAEEELQHAKDILEIKGQQQQEAEALFRESLEQLGFYEVMPLSDRGNKEIKNLLAQIEKKECTYAELRKAITSHQKEISHCEKEYEKYFQQENRAQSEVTKYKTQLTEKEEQAERLNQELISITKGQKASQLLAEIEKTLQEVRRAEKDSQEAYQEAEKQYQEGKDKLTRIESAWQASLIELEKIRQELKLQLELEAFRSAEEVEKSLLDEQIRSEKKAWIEAYQDQEKALHRDLASLKSQLGGRSVATEELSQQESLQVEAQEKFAEETRKRGAAEQTYKDIESKHQRWIELDKGYKELIHEGRLIERLRTLLRGDRFVEFLAQEQVEFVAQQASEQLKQMTQNRYALEIASDGGFLIRDDANGGVKRPVASLSGGETFQASLALALALSAQIQLQGKHPLEFFFLDEGFGSLDPETLDVVIATLERLQLGNRSIGVISHVQELQQRLSRRLLVFQNSRDMQGSQVRVEIG